MLGIFLVILLTGCGASYPLSIETSSLKRTPTLKVEMQALNLDWEWTLLYQEIGENTDLDTLILTSEYNQEKRISTYVQKAINQLKTDWYDISSEKSTRTELSWTNGSHQAILKTYTLLFEGKTISIAQLFFERDENINILSYASSTASHTQAFIDQISTIKLTF